MPYCIACGAPIKEVNARCAQCAGVVAAVRVSTPPGFEYTCVEIPLNIWSAGKKKGGEAAKALNEVIDRHAVNGFEFYRVDVFSVERPSGCLSGGGTVRTTYNVATFRRQK